MPSQTITVALTGASGLPYGLRLIECLLAAGVRVWVLYSQAAQVVAQQEMNLTLPSRPAAFQSWLEAQYQPAEGLLRVYGREEWFAPPASGSNPADAMVVCPCSMGTLAAIAAGSSDNLIERAADVSIKEQRKLVLPPSPGFYTHPQSVQDMVDFVVARIMDQVGVAHSLLPRWGEDRA